MGWVGVITNAGRDLFANYATGNKTLSIDTVKSGSGTIATEDMASATALASLKDSGVGYTTGSQTYVESRTVLQNGLKFRMRVGPAPASVGTYTLSEMGLFVNVTESGSTSSVMVAYFKTDSTTDVPLASTFPDFAYILSSVLVIDTSAEISITMSGSAYVSSSDFNAAISGLEEAVAGKLDADQGTENAGKFMTVGPDGELVPESVTMEGATAETAGTTGLVPAPAAGDQGKYLMGNGSWGTITIMTGASSGSAGGAGLAPAPAAGDQEKFLRGDGSWGTPPGRDYTAGTGLTLANNAFSLTASGATEGSYGPSADVTGNDGSTMSVPYITVDAYGRVTSVTNKTYTAKNTTYTAGTGLSLSGASFSLGASGASAGSYGPSANVTGNEGSTMSVPYITVDAYGRVTSISNKTYTAKNTTYSNFTTSAAGLVPAASGTGTTGKFLRGDGTWQTPANTTYSAGTGLSLNGTSFSLGTSGVTAGSYGPTGNVSGTNGTTINVPQITVDTYGRVTSVTNRVYTSVNTDTNTTYTAGNGLTLSGTQFLMSGSYTGTFTATKVVGAAWNDYAECRDAEIIDGGYCVAESRDGIMKMSTERLQPGCKLTSDTYGVCIGETKYAQTPIAICGRVLAYPYTDPSNWELGAAVCSAPDGKVDVMTREEIREYPERIIGTVSEIPDYDVWYAGDEDDPTPIKVNGRIWVYVR